MNQDPSKAKQALEDELRAYRKLDKINQSEEFNSFFDLQLDEVVKKMLECFTGTGPQSYDEFSRIRGEVVGILYPMQQIRGAKFISSQIKEQLNTYYNEQPN